MSYRLKEAVFKVRCNEPGCPFVSDFSIKENIMGATEADIDSEAWKIARNLAYNKHDALYGRKHPLSNPDIKKVSGIYDKIMAAPDVGRVSPPPRQAASPTRTYRKGEKIIRKGDKAGTICEVIRGMAVNESRPDLVYKQGSTFGFAALLENKDRMADIVAGEDGTLIASYNLKDLSRVDPAKARSLYNEAMEDIFRVMEYLEDYSRSLEKKVDRLAAENEALKKMAKKPAAAKKPVKRQVKKAVKKAAKKPAAKVKAKKRTAKKKAKRR
jgi:CRP-like cAMP-binding protein